MTNKKRKVTAGVLSAALAVGIVLSGTFAWQSINQTAKNEVAGEGINPGGRLHDDFNGEIKNVYVENFIDKDDEKAVPIFARVRLDEYLELGPGAGLKDGETDADGNGNQAVSQFNENGDINDPTTWKTHVPNPDFDDCNVGNPGFHDYFTMHFGGKTVYMPTFNKNKDSLAADDNGTLGGGNTGVPYGDYIKWELNDQKVGDAIYDADDNTVEDENVTKQKETHTAQETLDAKVITMQQWIEGWTEGEGETAVVHPAFEQGSFWVYDADGWAYWAAPIEPGTATGPLLNSIKQVAEPDKDWYYSINVVAQFATAGDLGSEDGTGFYDTDKGLAPSANAEKLLNLITGEGKVSITDGNDAALPTLSILKPGDTLNLKAALTTGDTVIEGAKIAWSQSNDSTDLVTLVDNGDGTATVTIADPIPEGKENTIVTLRATDGKGNFAQIKVQVVKAEDVPVAP